MHHVPYESVGWQLGSTILQCIPAATIDRRYADANAVDRDAHGHHAQCVIHTTAAGAAATAPQYDGTYVEWGTADHGPTDRYVSHACSVDGDASNDEPVYWFIANDGPANRHVADDEPADRYEPYDGSANRTAFGCTNDRCLLGSTHASYVYTVPASSATVLRCTNIK